MKLTLTPSRWVAFALAVVMMGSSSLASFADAIGTINLEKVIGSYDKAQGVMSDMKVREADIRKLQADFAKQLEDARKANAKSPVTSDALEKDLSGKLKVKLNEYRDWATAQQKAVDDELNLAIKTVAQRKGVDVVVSEGSVLLGGNNLTNDVITELNKKK
jgi:outer membrane protein